LAPHLHVVTLRPRAVLQSQDHPLEYIYFLHEGLASLLAVAPDGETIEAASVGCGGAVCPAVNPDEGDGFLTVIAQGAMRASRIATARLQIAERQSEALGHAMCACRKALLLQLRQNVVCVGIHSAEHRFSRWLLEAADRLETDVIPIPVTQEQVAERLGIRRTTVTLLAGKLQDIDFIRWRRSRVEILDRAGLEAMACSCYTHLRKRLGLLLPGTDRFSSSVSSGSR
jgi:CRP-like cAMP-binding protein